MGLSESSMPFSNPLEATKDRIQERLSEIVAIFASEFPEQYKTVLIKKLREDKGGDDWAYQLREASPPDWDLQAGLLTKKGASIFARSKWQERYFVVKNEAENFRIYYWKSETFFNLGVKPSDWIDGCGYDVEEEEEEGDDSKKDQTPPSLRWKLTPYDDKLRVWYLEAKSAEDKAKWMDTMKAACWKARSPRDPDDVVHDAFDRAFRETRRKCGEYGHFSYHFDEPQTLGSFMFKVVEREILGRDVYPKIPGAVKGRVKAAVDKSVGSSCTTASSGAWNAARKAADSAKTTISETAKKMLDPLLSAESTLKDKIVDKVTEIADPVLAKAGSDVLKPIADKLLSPVVAVYVEALRGFGKLMRPIVKTLKDKGKGDKDETLRDLCRGARRKIDYSFSGPMKEACAVLRQFTTNDIAKTINAVLSGGKIYDLYRLISKVEAGVRSVLHNAVFTFEKSCETTIISKTVSTHEQKDDEPPLAMDPEDAMRDIAPKLAEDLGATLTEKVHAIFLSFIETDVDESIATPAKSAVEPLADEVPDDLKDLIVLPNLAENVVNDAVANAIALIVDAGINKADLPFHKEAESLLGDVQEGDIIDVA
mmetsp:Transcript_3878/g.12640  ORF Transcript_3878/g.12640 Transcript_3878/m.12640 type:complete len:596 (+) Transcript_3878:84-1871(+)